MDRASRDRCLQIFIEVDPPLINATLTVPRPRDGPYSVGHAAVITGCEGAVEQCSKAPKSTHPIASVSALQMV